jgi:hypothetical protein
MGVPDIVTHPLGLVAFSLAILSGFATRAAFRKASWFPVAAVGLATFVIVAGIGLAFVNQDGRQSADKVRGLSSESVKSRPPETTATPSTIEQTVNGDCGVAVAGSSIGGSISSRCSTESGAPK